MNKTKAFTLIELLVVIAIIGILSGFIFISMNGATNAAKDAKRKSNVDALRKALLLYSVQNEGTYPAEATQCNIGSDCSALASALVPAYLPALPTDPNTGSYYTYVSATGTDFTVGSTLSNSDGYSYTASTGFGTTGGGSGAGAWLSSYSKRQAVTITAGETQTNVPVLLSVSYDPDMQADFDDIRFTSSDKTTLLDYWIESKVDSTSAKVWVEVSSLASGSNTIYLYYGNGSAASASSGANTFVLFDDFSGTMSNWTGGNGTITVSGGKINMSGGSYNDANAYFRSNQLFPVNASSSYAVEFMNWTATSVSAGYNWACGFFSVLNGTRHWLVPTSCHLATNHHTSGDSVNTGMYQASTSIYTNSSTATLVQSRDVTVVYGQSLCKISNYDNNVFGSSTSASINPAVVGAGFYVGCVNYDGGAYQGVSSFDAAIVRKALATDPTNSFGSEESN